MKTAKILSFTTLVAMAMGACAVSSAEEVKDSTTSTEIVSVEDSDIRNEDALRVAVGDFDDVEFLLRAEEMEAIADNADVSFNGISAQGYERSVTSMFSAEASERVETTGSTSSSFNGALTLAPATNTSETVPVRQSAVAAMSLSFDDSTEQYAVELQSLDKVRDGVGTLISSDDSGVSKGTVSFLGNFDSVGDGNGSYGISTLSVVGGVTLADGGTTYTWTGSGTSTDWTDKDNWGGTEWVEGSDAVFPYYSGDGNITNTEVTISGAIVAGTVTIGDTYTFTVETGASLTMDLEPDEEHDPHLTIAGSGEVTITGSSFSLEGLLTIAGSEVTFNDISLNGGTLEVTGGKVIFSQATTSILGEGKIDISTGDAEFKGIVNIGGTEGVTGTISIGTEDGNGGTVTFDGTVNIGHTSGSAAGTGELIIIGGTNTFVGAVNIGYSNGSSGILTISGGTNTFSSTVYIDYSGNTGTTGKLDISGGTNTFDSDVYISHNANSNYGGSMTISGGTNTFNGIFEVGEQKKGTLTITDGETYFKSTFICGGSGSSTVTISGDDTKVTFGASSGSSTTTVSIGYSSSATGTLTISGGTVKFGATAGSGTTNVVVGNAGSATGIIEITGGTVTFGGTNSSRKTNVRVGGNTSGATANGTITISGGSVTFDTYCTLYVGYYGTGKLEIKEDATVSFKGTVYVGGSDSSGVNGTGTMTISTGKATTFAGAVYVGNYGNGTLTITGGSNTFSSTLYIGSNTGGSGTMTISGTEEGSEKNTFTGQVRIGNNGTGSLTLENATNTFSAAVYLGYNSSGNGTLTLKSGDTTFSNTVTVGNSGTGELDITGGTAIFSGAVTVGNSGTGKLTISDGDTTFSSAVTVGSGSSESSVNISGGTATFKGNLTVKTGSTFSVGSGAQATIGKVKVDLASAVSNSGTIYLDEGVTFVLNDSLITASDDTSTTYTLISNGGTIIVGDSSSWSDLTISNFVDSSGSAISLGRSQLILDTAGVVTIYSGSTDLIWTGNTSNVWVNDQSNVINWRMEDGYETYFINGDNVTFDSTASTDKRTVSIGEAIVAGTVTVDGAAYTWAFSDGGSVTADSLTLTGTDASLTITGNGEFDLGNTSGQSLFGEGSITVSDGATLKLVEGGDDKYEDENITITVGSGGTLDVDGDGGTMFKLVLDGGTLTSSINMTETKKQLPSITLTADSTVDATNNLGMIGSGYTATSLDLGNYTLTKTGSGNFFLYNTKVTAGTIDVTAGTLELYGTDASAATVVVAEGATLYVGNNNGSYSKVGTLTSSGTVDLKAGSTLEITGNSTISGSLSLETSSGNSSTLKVTSGANLTLNISSSVLVGSGSTLSIGDSSSLTLGSALVFKDGNGNVSGNVTFSSSASLIINQSVFDGVTVDEATQTAAVAVITANTISFGDTTFSSNYGEGYVTDLVSSYITVQSGEYHVTGWYYYAGNGTLYAIFAVPEPSMFGLMFGLGAIGLVATRRRRRKAA